MCPHRVLVYLAADRPGVRLSWLAPTNMSGNGAKGGEGEVRAIREQEHRRAPDGMIIAVPVTGVGRDESDLRCVRQWHRKAGGGLVPAHRGSECPSEGRDAVAIGRARLKTGVCVFTLIVGEFSNRDPTAARKESAFEAERAYACRGSPCHRDLAALNCHQTQT
jgi:hypothetical protein